MSDLSPGVEPTADVQRAQLLDFVDGFTGGLNRDARVQFKSVELRAAAGSDDLIIAVYFSVDGIPRFAAVSYHLPDPVTGYAEYGLWCATKLASSLPAEELTVLHAN